MSLPTKLSELPVIGKYFSAPLQSQTELALSGNTSTDLVESKPPFGVSNVYARITSAVAPFKGVSGLSVVLGILFAVLVLSKFLSPVVSKLAMMPIVAPIASLVLLMLGEFEAGKLQSLLTQNAGVVASTLGVALLVLFIQNCLKSTLLLHSIQPSKKEYRAHALAGLTTPLVTAFIWSLVISFGYYELAFKSAGVGMLMVFAGPEIAKVASEATKVDLSLFGTVAKTIRFPMAVIAGLHLLLVWISYKWVYRITERVFAFFLRGDIYVTAWKYFLNLVKTWPLSSFNVASIVLLSILIFAIFLTSISIDFLGWPIIVLLISTLFINMGTLENREQERKKQERSRRAKAEEEAIKTQNI
jgi:heme exporter protein D